MSKTDFKYKNYVFDLYGTLVDIHTDEENFSFWKKVAWKLNANPNELKTLYKDLCKEQSEKVGESGEFDLLVVFEQIVKFYNSTLSPQEFAWYFRRKSTEYERLYKGVKRELKALKKAHRGVYLISNAQACFTIKELEKLHILKYFDGIVISSETGYKKPSFEIFDIAFKKFGIEKQNTIFTGNDLHDDILGAKNFGVDYFYIETKQSGCYPELEFLKLNH